MRTINLLLKNKLKSYKYIQKQQYVITIIIIISDVRKVFIKANFTVYFL
jgi:hypothetical protein